MLKAFDIFDSLSVDIGFVSKYLIFEAIALASDGGS